MKLYKFLHRAHVPSILRGRLLFKNFKEFRDLPPPIGDPNEGLATIETGEYAWKPEDGPSPLGPAYNITPTGIGTTFSNVSFEYNLPDYYISSFSFGDFERLTRTMLHHAPENYDAAVEILDDQLLIDHLLRGGRLESGLDYRSAFTRGLAGRRVTYAGPLAPPITNEQIAECLWRKTEEYASQSEYRLAMPPPISDVGRSVLITVDRAEWLFKRVV